MTSPKPGAPQDTKQALLQALTESVEDARVREAREAEAARRALRRRRSPILLGSAAIAIGLAAWLLLARPEWVFPSSVPVQSVQQLEAGLRIGLFLEARQVHAFANRTGRPPRTLAEAGVKPSGSSYTLLPDGRWQLEATQAGVRMRVTSQDDLSAFLGPSFTTLRGGRR